MEINFKNAKHELKKIFPLYDLFLVDQFEKIFESFDKLPDQRPCTCGAFSLTYVLGPLGFNELNGNCLLDEDFLSHLAGVVIEQNEVEPSKAVELLVSKGFLKEIEAINLFSKIWYRYPMQSSSDDSMLGTSPNGIAKAIYFGTKGELASIPIPARIADKSIQLTKEKWQKLLKLLSSNINIWNWHGIINYQMTHTLDPKHAAYTKENLQLADPKSEIPFDDWDAGHFVGIGGLWSSSSQTWMLLLDSYKERGFNGYQPQPSEMIRQGLIRSDSRGGGIQLIIESKRLEMVIKELSAIDIEFAMWDNGSPGPSDWIWELGL